MTILLESLRSIQYFFGCSPDELDYIKRFLSERTVRKGQIFLLEGDWSDYVFFIISGLVKVYKTSTESKEQILHIAGPGESLNDVSAFAGTPNAVSLLAMTSAVLYQVKKGDLQFIIRSYPQVALNVTKVLAHKVLRDSSLIESLSFNQVIGRLAKLLLKRSDEETDARLRLTQQDMAALVGTSREVIARSLKIMGEKGIIRQEHGSIVIIDKESLKEMVKTTS